MGIPICTAVHVISTLAAVSSQPTWGVSGPAFLGSYAALAAVVVVGVYLRRRALSRAGVAATTIGPRDLGPYELAMLNGGDELALAVAVADDNGGHDPDGLERAVRAFVRDHPSAPASVIALEPGPAAALASLRSRLLEQGLLLTDEQRTTIRRVGAWLGAVVGIGVVRIVAGYLNEKPVFYLVLLVGALCVLMAKWALVSPLTSLEGRQIVDEARSREGRIDKEITFGDPRVALALALYGATVLWNADPALAETLGLPRPGLGGGDGGGGCGGGCGGCGG